MSDRPTMAAAAPLYFGVATPEQGRAVAARLERDFLRPGGFVTTLIATGQQWDAPNGWPPLQWMAIQGARRYGRAELADTARARWLALNRRTYRATGRMMEKYDVVDPAREAGGGEYPTQDGFGWTNGVALALAADAGALAHSTDLPIRGSRAYSAHGQNPDRHRVRMIPISRVYCAVKRNVPRAHGSTTSYEHLRVDFSVGAKL